MPQFSTKRQGFTIVELLIVVVVITIIAAITLVTYSGIQKSAREAAQASVLAQASKYTQASFLTSGLYPAAQNIPTSSGLLLTLSSDANTGTFCITATGDRHTPKHIDATGGIADGPCDGHSGGPGYCPDNSYVAINGYFCDGTTGAAASLHSGAVKLDANTAPVPPGAPGAFVGRQASRDNVGTTNFAVLPGDIFCTTGWAATVSSTVMHRFGVRFIGSYGSSWQGIGITADDARNKWTKISGCVTAPAGTTSGYLWTQNDGANGGTADAHWYQTAITLKKQ